MLDIHLHIIPGIDDGPATLAETCLALRQIEAVGITTIVATPHLEASLAENPAAREAYFERSNTGWENMVKSASEMAVSISFRRGYEIMLDRPRPDLSDPRLRLAETSFVLVEFPYSEIPPNSHAALRWIRESDVIPILSHPERYDLGGRSLESLLAWRSAGAYLQVNMGSLAGLYGKAVAKTAWNLLERGAADYLASDFHGRGTHPAVNLRNIMEQRNALEQFEILTSTNPQRLLANELPLTVPPIKPAKLSWLQRIWPAN